MTPNPSAARIAPSYASETELRVISNAYEDATLRGRLLALSNVDSQGNNLGLVTYSDPFGRNSTLAISDQDLRMPSPDEEFALVIRALYLTHEGATLDAGRQTPTLSVVRSDDEDDSLDATDRIGKESAEVACRQRLALLRSITRPELLEALYPQD